jgi:hypothetical protein
MYPGQLKLPIIASIWNLARHFEEEKDPRGFCSLTLMQNFLFPWKIRCKYESEK